MTSKEVLKKIMEEEKVNGATLANRLGLSIATAWDRVNGKKKDMSVAILASTLASLDYKLVAVPRETKVTSGSYVVE